jgi:hypothetical protein
MPFSDLPLRNTALGYFGANLAIFPLTLIILLDGINAIYRGTISRLVLYSFIYISIISAYGVMLYGIESHGENLVVKGLKIVILLLFSFLVAKGDMNIPLIRKAVFISFFVALIGLFGTISEYNVFHGTLNIALRERGFSEESSVVALISGSLAFLVMYFVRGTSLKFVVYVLGLICVMYAQSKSGIILMLLNGVLMLLMVMYKSHQYNFIWYTLVLIVFFVLGYLLLAQLGEVVQRDIGEYTSVATRTTMFASALYVGVSNPFGVGVTGYIPAIAEVIPRVVEYIDSLGIVTMRYYEVLMYAYGHSARNVGTKSFLMDGFIMFGIPFLILVFSYLGKIIRELWLRNEFMLIGCVVFSTTALIFASSGVGIFTLFLSYGICQHVVKEYR